MGCFVSCFRNKDERPRNQRSDLGPRFHQKGLKEESVVKNGFASVSRNEDKDVAEALGHTRASDEQLKQETKHSNPSGATKENPVENFQSATRKALQEINGSDQLDAQSKPEDGSDEAKQSTPSLEKEKMDFSWISPGTASTEETTQSKNGVRVPVLNPDSPCPTPTILNPEMQTPATTYPLLHKGINTIITNKQHQGKLFNDFQSVQLGNKNDEAVECSMEKRTEDTPEVVVRNGIPNTTTKYKEDQRVKWHATPFEERLERILSDEEMPPARKLVSGRLIRLEE